MSEEAIANTAGEEPFENPDFQEVEHAQSDNAGVVDAETAPPAAASGIEPFSLVKEKFTLSSINTRGEKHGDERVPALDLKFTTNLSNSVLLKLHPGLRDALYVPDRQTDIEADYGRKLRFPLIGTIPYDLEVPRVKLRVHDCDSEDNDVVLIDGRANKFKITPMEGGSVALAFRVQFSDYDTDALAALARVLQQTVPISLACEAAEEEPTIEEQVEQVTQKPKSAAWLAGEKLFVNEGEDTLTGSLPFPDDLPDFPVDAQGEAPAAETAPAESNVTPIKAPRKKRTANGAE
jgi:hypothetical protein